MTDLMRVIEEALTDDAVADAMHEGWDGDAHTVAPIRDALLAALRPAVEQWMQEQAGAVIDEVAPVTQEQWDYLAAQGPTSLPLISTDIALAPLDEAAERERFEQWMRDHEDETAESDEPVFLVWLAAKRDERGR